MASTVLGAFGGALDAYYTEKAGDEEQRYLNEQADLTLDLYNEEENRLRRRGKDVLGKQQAYYGKAGVQIESGSPARVLADTAADIELDALTLRYSGKLEADTLKYQGALAESTAEMASNVRLVSAGTSVASAYGQYAGSRGSKPKSLLEPTRSSGVNTQSSFGQHSSYSQSVSGQGVDSDWDSGW